jgi:hypothetical protein
MDWKAFVASIIGSLAWPAVVALLIIILRRQIVDLAERVQEISLPGGAKATFEKQLEVARTIEARNTTHVIESKNAADIALDESSRDRLIPETEERRFMRLVATAPEAAVIETYNGIEELVFNRIAPLLGIKAVNARSIVSELVKRDLTDQTTLELFDTLNKARNVAAHSRPGLITSTEAFDYGQHARRLIGSLSFAIGRREGQVRAKSPAPS